MLISRWTAVMRCILNNLQCSIPRQSTPVSSSTRGRRHHIVCSAHGPILGTAEGVSSEQASLNGTGTARWCEGDLAVCASLKRVESLLGRQMPRKKLLWVVCYLTYRQRGWYVIWHTGNVAKQWKTAPTNYRLGILEARSGINFGICNEVRSLDAENPSLTAQVKGRHLSTPNCSTRHVYDMFTIYVYNLSSVLCSDRRTDNCKKIENLGFRHICQKPKTMIFSEINFRFH